MNTTYRPPFFLSVCRHFLHIGKRGFHEAFAKNLFSFQGIAAFLTLLMTACHSPQDPATRIMENANLRIEALASLPMVRSYTYKPTGVIFQGDEGSTGWVVNGQLIPWNEWKIVVAEDHSVDKDTTEPPGWTYRMSLPSLNLSFEYTLQLKKEGLHMALDHITDPDSRLKSISWGDKSLLNATGDSLHWYALQSAIQPDHPFENKKVKNRGLWGYDEKRGTIRDTVPALSTIDACIWQPGKVAAGLTSNTDLFPVKFQNIPGKTISLGLNTWFHRLQDQVMPDLSADLLLSGDYNGDGDITDHDYFRWKNSRLPDVPDWLRGSISYKIFNDAPTLKEPNTTLEESDKIVTAIHNVTDGLPQIVYLTGWQFRGHDTGYPSFDQWNERLGPHQGIYQRAAWYRDHLNTTVSYHINIDDAYPANPGFDPALMATDFDGGPMFWESFHGDSAFHISHYKDVKSGAIFKRLEGFLQTVPVAKILHIDAMRTTNANPAWEKDSAGVNEELELGLKPIMRWLKNKGIEVTTEGQNGVPLEMAGVVDGFYHIDDLTEAELLVHHRKLIGGGWNEGRGRLECGIGTSLQQDIAYKDLDGSLSFKKDWKILKERIFLGSLLYIYYQQRQLLDATKTPDHWMLRFDDSTRTTVDVKNDHLLVTRGPLVIAKDDDRFIPIDNAIYIFSKEGGPKQWLLPDAFKGKALDVFSLTEKGRSAAPAWRLSGDSINLSMTADVPVKIILKKSS